MFSISRANSHDEVRPELMDMESDTNASISKTGKDFLTQ